MGEREDSPGENICLWEQGFFRNTFNQAHIERSFIELLYDHMVDFIFHIKIIFFADVIK